MRRCFLVIIVTLTLYTAYGIRHTAQAAEVGLAVTKNLFDISLSPGDAYQGTLTVFSQAELAIPVKLELSLWDMGSEDELVFVASAGEGEADPRQWFDFGAAAQGFTLPPYGDRDLPFTVTPPAGTAAGSYFAMARFVSDLPEAAFGPGGPRFVPELGVLFFVGVAPLSLDGERAAYDGRVAAFTPQGSGRLTVLERFAPGASAGVYDELVRRFALSLENRGLFHFQANGEIMLTNMLGAPVARFALPRRYLLPGHVRTLTVAGAEQQATWWERYGHLGRYTATLTLAVPGHDVPVVSQVSFWVFPWQVAAAILWLAGTLVFLGPRFSLAWQALRKPTARGSGRAR